MSKGALGLLAAYWPEDTPRYTHVPLKVVGDTTIYPIAAASPERAALMSAGAPSPMESSPPRREFLASRSAVGSSPALASRSQ